MPSPVFSKPSRLAAWLAIAACGLVACGDGSRQESVPTSVSYDDALRARVSVSGVSSGGYMAVQAHVAYAERIGGVAAIAAGPYHCAEGDVKFALGRCMTGQGLDVLPMIAFAREAVAAGDVALTESIRDARVWVFHSPADAVVSPAAGEALVDFYSAFVDPGNIVKVTSVAAAHGWVTSDRGLPCEEQGGDYINACDYDAAEELLHHLYGELEPKGDCLAQNLAEADLSGFFPSGSNISGKGLIYTPLACNERYADCRLHIAFHGCVQGFEFIGDRFAAQAGINEWAESNRIIVVYPQLEKSMFNPKGCWDWWGYTGEEYDLRSGKQVSGVAALIDAFASGKLLHNSLAH
jgi:poly(3-hydroxybutyrate) depolymerase